MARFLLLAATLFLTACFGGQERVTDFSDRSVVYGWFDIGDIKGNTMTYMDMRRIQPVNDTPYWSVGYKKFKDGYLFVTLSAVSGTYEFNQVSLMSCAGGIICSNTIREYQFGPYGDAPGKTVVRGPGVYHTGNYRLIHENSGGLFRQGEFSTEQIRGPSRNELLREVLTMLEPQHDLQRQRIMAAMR